MENNTENVKKINYKEAKKMSGIKIESKNIGKIILAIRTVEKGCSTRLLSIIDIETHLDRIENHLNIPSKALERTEVTVYPNSMDYAHSYSGSPKQTAFTAVYHNGYWYLTKAFRGQGYQTNPAHVELSETAKEAILKNHVAF